MAQSHPTPFTLENNTNSTIQPPGIAGDSPPMNNFLYSSTGSPQCYEVDSYRIMDFSIYAGYMCLFYKFVFPRTVFPRTRRMRMGIYVLM